MQLQIDKLMMAIRLEQFMASNWYYDQYQLLASRGLNATLSTPERNPFCPASPICTNTIFVLNRY